MAKNIGSLQLYKMIKLVLALLLVAHTSDAQSFQCQRSTSSKQKQKSPPFLCSVTVLFVRLNNCSARITEEFVFPHTTGRDAFRDIPQWKSLQGVSNVTLLRNGEQLPVRYGIVDNNANEVRVMLPTQKDSSPVKFELSYNLMNAVMRWTQSCTSDEEAVGDRNIMRWRSGKWDKTFDVLKISFLTNNENATLSPVGGSTMENAVVRPGGKEVVFEKRSISKNIEVYVTETGVNMCWIDTICFSPTSSSNLRKYLLFGAAAIFAVIFCCCCICCKLCGGVSKLQVFGKPMRRFNSGHSSSDFGDGGFGGDGGDCGGGDDGGGGGG